MNKLIALGEFVIQRQADFPYAKGELSRLLSAIRLASKVMNSQINKAGLVDHLLGSLGKENVQGEEQKKMDVYANELFINALKARNEVCGIASEEEERFVFFENDAGLNCFAFGHSLVNEDLLVNFRSMLFHVFQRENLKWILLLMTDITLRLKYLKSSLFQSWFRIKDNRLIITI